MGLLDQIKNVVAGQDPNTPKPVAPDNRVDRVDQLKCLYYQWSNTLPAGSKNAFSLGLQVPVSADASSLAAARSYDISNHVVDFVYQKGKNGAAGSFSLTLESTLDWARFMRAGEWLVVFLSGDGDLPLPIEGVTAASNQALPGVLGNVASAAQALGSLASAALTPSPKVPLPAGPDPSAIAKYRNKTRLVGIIQRVGIKSITTIDGAVDANFVITGKDFGGIYEDTELWFNANNAESSAFTATIESYTKQFSRNLSDLLGKWHDVFLSPDNGLTNQNAAKALKSFFPEQWILPDQMVKDLGIPMKAGAKGYFGEIANLKEFSGTVFENPDPNPLSGLQGRCWDRIKGLSQPEFHELFTELSDNGTPKLYFRPIPWALDKTAYPNIGKMMFFYKDLASPGDIDDPVPVGTIVSTLSSLSDDVLDNLPGSTVTDTRTNHSVAVSAVQVENFDIGPDYHSKSNFFLVDSMKSTWDQMNAFALTARDPRPFPLRNESDIKRYGFRPYFVSLQALVFSKTVSKAFGNTPDQDFILEANEVIRDLHSNVEDFYSGSLTMAGDPDIKLGKVLVTDESFQGIKNMVFYIEGYTDHFTVNGDGVCAWTQNLMLTRGIQQNVLAGGSSKDRQSMEPGTFQVFNKNANPGPDSVLGKLKNFIK